LPEFDVTLAHTTGGSLPLSIKELHFAIAEKQVDQAKRFALIEYLRRVGGLDEDQPAHVVALE